MGPEVVWVVLGAAAIVVLGVIGALLSGRLPYDPMAPATSTVPDEGLPDGPVTAGDVPVIAFDTALRGYRMDQVDRVLDRLQGEIADRDRLIARLRAGTDPSREEDPGADRVRAASPGPGAAR